MFAVVGFISIGVVNGLAPERYLTALLSERKVFDEYFLLLLLDNMVYEDNLSAVPK